MLYHGYVVVFLFLDRFRFHVSAIIHLKDDVFKPSIYRNCRCVNISVGPLSENIKVWRSHLPTLPYLFIFYIVVVYYQRNHSSVFSLLITLKCSTLTATTYSINIPSYPDLCVSFLHFFLFDANYVYHISHINTHTYVQVPFCYVSYYNEVKRWCGLAMAFLNWTSMFYFFTNQHDGKPKNMKLTYTAVLFRREPETVTSPKLVATSRADIQLQ